MFIEEQTATRSSGLISNDPGGSAFRRASSRDELLADLGIWLSGLESFLVSGRRSFAETHDGRAPDASREFSLIQSGLQRCLLLLVNLTGRNQIDPFHLGRRMTNSELLGLQSALRDAIMLGDGLISAKSVGPGEWNAWSRMLLHRLRSETIFAKLIRNAEEAGERFLPPQLLELSETNRFLAPEHAELALILPRFGKILKWLSVVGKMLAGDEPLKSALMIFARVNEQVFDFTNYVNNRLERFPDQEAELFSALDAASYTASIELKKVYSQELTGVVGMRPTPSIYARMETAYALLNESFQQTLASLARLIYPEADIFHLFPNFRIKLDQSLKLRQELYAAVGIVQRAEQKPEKDEVNALHAALRSFMGETVGYLFYKDTETVERFIEEILITKQNKDLVPILHRFGAYLETLFGQVNLRAVLSKHPFDPKP